MLYRRFGDKSFDTSILGLGTMRLPLSDDGSGRVDEPKAITMIRRAIDGGINYIDTAYVYHDGNSEKIVGKALENGYRERVWLVDKNPVFLAKKYEDFDGFLDEQLERLKTHYLDVYLLHSLDAESWKRNKALGVLEFLDEAQAKGKIRISGFSIHDELPLFKDLLDAYDWGMAMIQMNIVDRFEQVTAEGLKLAESRGIPMAIMEPLKGGLLADPPEEIRKIFEASGRGWSPVEWAFRWAAQFPAVKVILSGMSDLTQLEQNLEIADRNRFGEFTEKDNATAEAVRLAYEARVQVPCTSCRYCMPCPVGVNIPKNFRLLNEAGIYGTWDNVRQRYQNEFKPSERADQCVACRQCEPICPQSIEISREMLRVHQTLGLSL